MNTNSISIDGGAGKKFSTGAIILCLIIFIAIVIWFSNKKKENYRPMTQNFNYRNKNDIAYKLEYGELEEPALNPKGDNRVMGPNSNFGVNKNSPTVVSDK